MKNKKERINAVSGKGSYLFLQDGRAVIDLVSSWWVNVHGHGREEIAAAIYQQALKLEHVLFADLQHEGAYRLIEKLSSHLPSSLHHFFFSDDGSTAVEVALKMATQYWKNRKEAKRNKWIVFEGSYHGDSVGCMSLGQRGPFTAAFQDLLFEVFSLPFPATYENDSEVEQKEAKTLELFSALLKKEKGRIAAVFIEPLVQGASGMRMCREKFLIALEAEVRKEGCLLVYDEVMTGFGRTGEWFSLVKSATCPDLLCLAKGLTGGFLPLALTICTQKIYDAFLGEDLALTFYHGHSYTANPLGCAAAIASLELLEKEEAFRKIEAMHRKELQPFFQEPTIEKIRLCGTIAAMDLKVEEKGYGSFVGEKIQKLALERGIYLRPLGNVLYLLPPYSITSKELAFSYEVIRECLKEI